MEGVTETAGTESKQTISPEKTASFQNYIYQGGIKIKEGKYNEAIEYFRNKEEIQKIGKNFASAVDVIVNEIPKPEEYRILANKAAEHSKNNADGSVKISRIRVFKTVPNGLPQEQTQLLPNALQHEIALVSMEEWLHALQDLRNKPLAGFSDHEIDVAAYMKRNGIPLTEIFMARYGRGKALESLQK